MSKKVLLLLLLLGVSLVYFLSTTDEHSVTDLVFVEDVEATVPFDKTKWPIKKGWGYAYRNEMLDALINDPEIRKLKRKEVIELLGKPSRTNENYLYFLIDQKRAFILPLHTKTLVIKFSDEDSIEWMKIHE